MFIIQRPHLTLKSHVSPSFFPQAEQLLSIGKTSAMLAQILPDVAACSDTGGLNPGRRVQMQQMMVPHDDSGPEDGGPYALRRHMFDACSFGSSVADTGSTRPFSANAVTMWREANSSSMMTHPEAASSSNSDGSSICDRDVCSVRSSTLLKTMPHMTTPRLVKRVFSCEESVGCQRSAEDKSAIEAYDEADSSPSGDVDTYRFQSLGQAVKDADTAMMMAGQLLRRQRVAYEHVHEELIRELERTKQRSNMALSMCRSASPPVNGPASTTSPRLTVTCVPASPEKMKPIHSATRLQTSGGSEGHTTHVQPPSIDKRVGPSPRDNINGRHCELSCNSESSKPIPSLCTASGTVAEISSPSEPAPEASSTSADLGDPQMARNGRNIPRACDEAFTSRPRSKVPEESTPGHDPPSVPLSTQNGVRHGRPHAFKSNKAERESKTSTGSDRNKNAGPVINVPVGKEDEGMLLGGGRVLHKLREEFGGSLDYRRHEQSVLVKGQADGPHRAAACVRTSLLVSDGGGPKTEEYALVRLSMEGLLAECVALEGLREVGSGAKGNHYWADARGSGTTSWAAATSRPARGSTPWNHISRAPSVSSPCSSSSSSSSSPRHRQAHVAPTSGGIAAKVSGAQYPPDAASLRSVAEKYACVIDVAGKAAAEATTRAAAMQDREQPGTKSRVDIVALSAQDILLWGPTATVVEAKEAVAALVSGSSCAEIVVGVRRIQRRDRGFWVNCETLASGVTIEVDHKRGSVWIRGRPASVEESRRDFHNKLASLFAGEFLAVPMMRAALKVLASPQALATVAVEAREAERKAGEDDPKSKSSSPAKFDEDGVELKVDWPCSCVRLRGAPATVRRAAKALYAALADWQKLEVSVQVDRSIVTRLLSRSGRILAGISSNMGITLVVEREKGVLRGRARSESDAEEANRVLKLKVSALSPRRSDAHSHAAQRANHFAETSMSCAGGATRSARKDFPVACAIKPMELTDPFDELQSFFGGHDDTRPLPTTEKQGAGTGKRSCVFEGIDDVPSNARAPAARGVARNTRDPRFSTICAGGRGAVNMNNIGAGRAPPVDSNASMMDAGWSATSGMVGAHTHNTAAKDCTSLRVVDPATYHGLPVRQVTRSFSSTTPHPTAVLDREPPARPVSPDSNYSNYDGDLGQHKKWPVYGTNSVDGAAISSSRNMSFVQSSTPSQDPVSRSRTVYNPDMSWKARSEGVLHPDVIGRRILRRPCSSGFHVKERHRVSLSADIVDPGLTRYYASPDISVDDSGSSCFSSPTRGLRGGWDRSYSDGVRTYRRGTTLHADGGMYTGNIEADMVPDFDVPRVRRRYSPPQPPVPPPPPGYDVVDTILSRGYQAGCSDCGDGGTIRSQVSENGCLDDW